MNKRGEKDKARDHPPDMFRSGITRILFLLLGAVGAISLAQWSTSDDVVILGNRILQQATVGESYESALLASGGNAPYSWHLLNGSLPRGLSLSRQGVITGAPCSTGSFTFRAAAADSSPQPQTLSSSFSFAVAERNDPSILWEANMETGDTSQWFSPSAGVRQYGELIDNFGARASSAFAHCGQWSLALQIGPAPENSVRMSREVDSVENGGLLYSAWYFFPRSYRAGRQWKILEWLSASQSARSHAEPFYAINVDNRANGSMYFRLRDSRTAVHYSQWIKDIPVGQWVKLDAYSTCTADGTGQIWVWQDGALLFDLGNVQTSHPKGDCRWAIGSSSEDISPAPATIYLDDAVIKRQDLGPAQPPDSGGGAALQLRILNASLPGAIATSSYSANLTASMGLPPYRWRLLSGSLPDGVSLDNTGRLSGVPTRPGLFSFEVAVEDSANPRLAARAAFALEVLHPGFARLALWSADFESGGIAQWEDPSSSGGPFHSGIAEAIPTRSYAHGGNWGLAMTITAPPVSGARMFRWREPQLHPRLHYTSWHYFPRRNTTPTFWNVAQWKSKLSPGVTDPFFVLNVNTRPNGAMYLALFDWQKQHNFDQWVKDIPLAQWFQLAAYYHCAGDATGRVTIWQDGVLLFDLPNVQTRYANGDCQWSLNNYSDSLSPSQSTIYIDDAIISRNSLVGREP